MILLELLSVVIATFKGDEFLSPQDKSSIFIVTFKMHERHRERQFSQLSLNGIALT